MIFSAPALILPPEKPAIVRSLPSWNEIHRRELATLKATFPFPVFAPRGLASLNYITTVGNNTNLSSYSFPSTSLGTSTSNRKIVLAICGGFASAALTSVTVDGVAASLAHASAVSDSNTAGESSQIWYCDLGAGNTSGTIVVNLGSTGSGCRVSVYDVKGAVSGGATSAANNNASVPSASISIGVGGVAFAAVSERSNSTETHTWSWSNNVNDFDPGTSFTSIVCWSSNASVTSAAGQSGTCSVTPSAGTVRTPAMSIAAWNAA